MTDKTIDLQLLSYLNKLEKNQKISVLNYLKKIAKKDNSRTDLLDLAGSISKEDLKLMELSIDKDCEKIDENEW